MFEGQVSDVLKAKLSRQMRADGAGTPKARGNERPGAANEGALRQVTRQQGGDVYGNGGVRLCWTNPHMTKRTDKRARLVICE